MPVWIACPIDCFLSNSRSICPETASDRRGDGTISTFESANIGWSCLPCFNEQEDCHSGDTFDGLKADLATASNYRSGEERLLRLPLMMSPGELLPYSVTGPRRP
jgi:hypothetical protein